MPKSFTSLELTPASQALFDSQNIPYSTLPVCDHYAGVEKRMIKSLELQAKMGAIFDVTLDAEDGAPVGNEKQHIALIASLINSQANMFKRVGVRIHCPSHPAFENDVQTLVKQCGEKIAYITLPKIADFQELVQAQAYIYDCYTQTDIYPPAPLHVLIETHGALKDVWKIAQILGVQCLSFGLMDFVSAHHGAIHAQAMQAQEQFVHPLIVRAKLEIAAACHAHNKTPSHSVITELHDTNITYDAATKASYEFGYTRMWSIHPQQISPIIEAFRPKKHEVADALRILNVAYKQNWAPIKDHQNGKNTLHDRASYRYYWYVLNKALRTGLNLPQEFRALFFHKSN